MVENVRDGIPHLTHGLLERARGFSRVGTVRALLVGGLTDAADRGQRSIQNTDDLAQRDVFRRFDKGIAAPDTSTTRQQAGTLQGEQYLFEKLHGDILTLCDFMALQHATPVCLAEFEQRAEPIFTLLGELHGVRSCLVSYSRFCRINLADILIQAPCGEVSPLSHLAQDEQADEQQPVVAAQGELERLKNTLMNSLRRTVEARRTVTDLLNQDLAEVECAELAWNQAVDNRVEVSARMEGLASLDRTPKLSRRFRGTAGTTG